MDAQYKELQSRAKKPIPDPDKDDMPMSREEEAKFMQAFRKNRFYNDYRDRDSNRNNWRSSGRNDYNRDNYRSNTDDKPYNLQRQFNDFMKSHQSTNSFVKETFMDLKIVSKIIKLQFKTSKLSSTDSLTSNLVDLQDLFQATLNQTHEVATLKLTNHRNLIMSIIDVIDEILEEDFDALLDEGNEILLSIEGTLIEEEIFSEFDKFMAMTVDENFKSKYDTDEPPFEKITINTDYKIKTALKNLLRISNSNLFLII
uniref:Reverse transcriptase domain-containing protein n=1 Tax=Tanacetum cinerariifolium TaxID=118510 RepID=A0A6L2LIJ5_TANCI|nr:hypothetical protein [Tanacetum cinerariifolium]